MEGIEVKIWSPELNKVINKCLFVHGLLIAQKWQLQFCTRKLLAISQFNGIVLHSIEHRHV